MFREILEEQKLEKNKLLESPIERLKLPIALNKLNSDLIKVIIGPRRAGKSMFCHLLLRNQNYAYVNFDDDKLFGLKDTDELIKTLLEIYKNPDYIFFDEIQNLNNWELFINKLHRRGYNLILTGSNANLLSKELASSLTGRHLAFEILPLSFAEASPFCNLHDYMVQGGFPEVVLKGYDAKDYLSALVDSILLKDVVRRYRVRFPQKLIDLFTYLAANFASPMSFTKLKNILDFNSTHTVQNYLKYLNEAYLIFALNPYSNKIKEQINAPKKIYLVDNGFIEAKAFQVSKNRGRLIENLVFIELINRGFQPNKDIFYYKTKKQQEVDFVLRQGIEIKELIQVSYDISDPDTYKRETKALLVAGEELKCKNLTLINMDRSDCSDKLIKLIKLEDWLLGSGSYPHNARFG
ncbi:MAG: ATP-binding protein [Cyanobacteria bacterium]|nr:ATP-binding protein [Cyanobacteriota bacterium]